MSYAIADGNEQNSWYLTGIDRGREGEVTLNFEPGVGRAKRFRKEEAAWATIREHPALGGCRVVEV